MISGRRHQLSHWRGWIVFAAALAPGPPSQRGGRGTPGQQRSVKPCHSVTSQISICAQPPSSPRLEGTWWRDGIRTLSLTPSEESWSVSTEEGEAREARVSANMEWVVLSIMVKHGACLIMCLGVLTNYKGCHLGNCEQFYGDCRDVWIRVTNPVHNWV